MKGPSFQKAKYYKVMGTLLLAITADQLISLIFPWESDLLGIKPAFVFLDIPVPLPFKVGLLPVLCYFTLFYFLFFCSHRPDESNHFGWSPKADFRKIFWSLVIIPIVVLSAGALYAMLKGSLPRPLQHGIESFGFNTDLYLPIEDSETIHLNGSMLILVAAFISLKLFRRTMKTIFNRYRTVAPRADTMPSDSLKPRDSAAPTRMEQEPSSLHLV